MTTAERLELRAFLRAILDTPDLDGAGALADWLDEHGDPRGRLLRKRWRKWRTHRDRIQSDKFLVLCGYAHAHLAGIDGVFAGYFFLRFKRDINFDPARATA